MAEPLEAEKWLTRKFGEDDGRLMGSVIIDVVATSWDRWHRMGYTDLRALEEDLRKARENKRLLLSQLITNERGIQQTHRAIDERTHPDSWRHVSGRLYVQIDLLSIMQSMIYTDGYPLPSWDELAPELQAHLAGRIHAETELEQRKEQLRAVLRSSKPTTQEELFEEAFGSKDTSTMKRLMKTAGESWPPGRLRGTRRVLAWRRYLNEE